MLPRGDRELRPEQQEQLLQCQGMLEAFRQVGWKQMQKYIIKGFERLHWINPKQSRHCKLHSFVRTFLLKGFATADASDAHGAEV